MEGVAHLLHVAYLSFSPLIFAHAKVFYLANYPRVPFFDDVWLRPFPSVQLHAYLGGAPCTPWVAPGKHLGFEDPSGHSFHEQRRLIYHNRPVFVVLENSDRLMADDGGEFVRTVVQWLTTSEKFADARRPQADQLGLPSRRKRLFFMTVLRACPLPQGSLK